MRRRVREIKAKQAEQQRALADIQRVLADPSDENYVRLMEGMSYNALMEWVAAQGPLNPRQASLLRQAVARKQAKAAAA